MASSTIAMSVRGHVAYFSGEIDRVRLVLLVFSLYIVVYYLSLNSYFLYPSHIFYSLIL